ncbi:hypothetical protein ACT691_18930 [Vibrio metschnikovii]
MGHTAAVESLVGKCDEALCLLPFEPKWLRPPPKREAALKKAMDEIESLNRAIWLSGETDLGPLADLLDDLALRFQDKSGEPGSYNIELKERSDLSASFIDSLDHVMEAA